MKAKHGGIDPWAAKEAGIDPAAIRDFSISINPTILPDSIKEVIWGAALSRYPDSRSRALVDALAAGYRIPDNQILVVNGTSQAIFLIAAAFLSPGDKVLIAGPTYAEYREACRAYGAEVTEVSAKEEDEFHPRIPDLVDWIKKEEPVLFWICNPNSPTGAWIDESERDELASACREAGCRMVIDEAYARFAPPGLLPEDAHPEVIHLHSMTKDFSIPGLRLGWVRGDEGTITRIRRFQPDWSVSAPAQDAGVAIMEHLPFFEESWARTRTLTRYLVNELQSLGLKPVPGAGNFVLVRIGDDEAVKTLSANLWKRLVMVRDCASFGLEGFIRIGTRSRDDIDFLIDLIAQFNSGQ